MSLLSGQLLPKRHLNKVIVIIIIIIITLRNTVATVSGIIIGTDAKDDHFLSQSSSYLVLQRHDCQCQFEDLGHSFCIKQGPY